MTQSTVTIDYIKLLLEPLMPVGVAEWSGVLPTFDGDSIETVFVNPPVAGADFSGIIPTVDDYDIMALTPVMAYSDWSCSAPTVEIYNEIISPIAESNFTGIIPGITDNVIDAEIAGAEWAGVVPTVDDYDIMTLTPPKAISQYVGAPPLISLSKPITVITGISVYPVVSGSEWSGILPAITGGDNEVLPTIAYSNFSGIVPVALDDIIDGSIATANFSGVLPYVNPNLTAFEWFLENMPPNYPAVALYRCYLTGTTDLYLPISSFQSRLRDGDPTYLEVVVPNALDYIDDIADRAGEEIVIEKGLMFQDSTSEFIELIRVDFELAPYDLGPTNKTIRLSGYSTTSNTNPKTTALLGVSGESLQSNGKRRIRATVDFLARPGDTVTWNSGTDSMVAGLITLTVSAEGQQTMDITEA